MSLFRSLGVAFTVLITLYVSGGEAQERLVSGRTLIVGTKEAPPFAKKKIGEPAWQVTLHRYLGV